MTTPLQKWVKEVADLMTPDKIYWMNGSDEEAKELAKMAESEKVGGNPILTKLNDKDFQILIFTGQTLTMLPEQNI